jgi:hypothetical protein
MKVERVVPYTLGRYYQIVVLHTGSLGLSSYIDHLPNEHFESLVLTTVLEYIYMYTA